MLARLAWRNLWRNRRRTLIAVAALSLGAAGLVLTHSFAETMYGSMIDVATRGLIGHLQVHGAGYQAEPDIFTVVRAPEAVSEEVERALPGAVVLPRVIGFGLVAAGEKSTAVAIIGLEPGREQQHSNVLTVTVGRGLADVAAREVVLAAPLAKRLGVTPGAEVVLLSQAADGSIANDLYTVVGLSSGTGSVEVGGAAAFLHLRDAQDFFALGDGVHQLVVTLPDGSPAPRQAASKLRARFSGQAPPLEALSWNEMLPDVERAIVADRQGSYVMDFVVFLVVVLGMLNAMTMATWERTFELGVLSALGTRPSGVLGLVLVESFFIGLLSLVAGAALAWLVLAALPPLDLGELMGESDFAGVALPTVVKARLDPLGLVMALFTVAATCVVGGLYPAWRVSRLLPVESMRYRA
jgi:ABC-type lipoprotein release transport system permease subunit